MGIGILGIAAVLPPTVRTNDYWSQELIESWSAKLRFDESPSDEPRFETEGQQIMFDAMKDAVSDPFHGVRERRIAAPGTLPSDLEIAAARGVIRRADARLVDGLLVASAVPDNLVVPNAPLIHQELGLPSKTLSFAIDSAANSLIHQLQLAWSLIRTNVCNTVLLVQSSLMSRLADELDSSGTWWGDGATALLVGHDSKNEILSFAHRTDGSYYDVAMARSKEEPWYEGEKSIRWQVSNQQNAKRLILSIADLANEVVSEALNKANLRRADVTFFCAYQGAGWIQEGCKRVLGLEHTSSTDLYPTTGLLGPASLPLALWQAAQMKALSPNDVAVLFAGGSGVSYSATVLRGQLT